MAEYARFEIFLPVTYTTTEVDPHTNQTYIRKHALSDELVNSFIRSVQRRYHGVTQANPATTAMYRGYWQERVGAPVEVDHLTYLFALVSIDEVRKAIGFFETWKARLEARLHQTVILITYYPVKTIGDFL